MLKIKIFDIFQQLKKSLIDIEIVTTNILDLDYHPCSGNMIDGVSFKKVKRFFKKLSRGSPLKPKELMGELNSVIRGWGNYYKIGNVKKIFKRLDCWIRTRMRTFIEKKKSHYANIRITNYALKSKYKLASLMTLI